MTAKGAPDASAKRDDDEPRREGRLELPGTQEDRRAEAILLHAGAMAKLGAWWIDVSDEKNLDTNPLRWSDEVYRIFGFEPKEVEPSNALFFAHVHPDDKPRVVEAVSRALAERRPYTLQHRIVTRGGEEKIVLERAEARYDEAGKLVLLVGAVQDVTEQVRAQEALRESEERARRQLAEIEAIYTNAPVGLCIFDRDLRWVRLNERIAEVDGVPLEAHLGKTPRELLPEVGEQTEAALRKILETGEALDLEFTATNPAKPGVTRSWEERWVPIKDDGGRVIGVSVAMLEVTQRKRAEERVAFLARFPEEDPNPVLRLSLDAAVLYANEAARTSELGVAPGREAPAQIAELARRAVREGTRIKTEVKLAAAVFLMTVVPIGEEVSVFAQDITALKEAEEALREVNRRKDDFIATLSHELRNPLAPIRNSAYVLEYADPSGEQASRARSVIQRQAEHLTRLVDDLLDVTRVASGKIELRRARVDLREIVSRAGDDLRAVLHDRGVALRTDYPEASVWADADATRIAQVVGNLLHNAGKFSRRGDEVALSLMARGGTAEIRVRDTGAGIDPALLPHVFDRFVQGKRTLAMTEGGLGLGLALVKGIAELHGGNVSVESLGTDRGAEFIVRLPLAPATATQSATDRAARRAASSRRVLVVDDNTDAAHSLADLIGLLGHRVDVAYDGPSAIAKARADPPEVVLCDIGLPGMSGYEVAQALRTLGAGATRLIALSGYAQPEDVKKALDAGFDAHLAKPPSLDDIERLLA
jgi:PAS domain S-box-containing protein